MTVSISDEARQAWRDFAAEHGVSITGLAECVGMSFPPPGTVLPPLLRSAVEAARDLDVERRSRRRDPYS